MYRELRAFLQVRRFYTAVALMLAVGISNYVFGAFPIPILSRSQQGYGHAVAVLIFPVVVSLVSLGALVSRLSEWERMAARSLVAPRLAVGVAVILLAIVVLVPGSIRAGVPSSTLLVIQGVLALVGMGMCMSWLVGYEIQVVLITSYGLISVLLVRAVPDPISSAFLVGQSSLFRLMTATFICCIGMYIYVVGLNRRITS